MQSDYILKNLSNKELEITCITIKNKERQATALLKQDLMNILFSLEVSANLVRYFVCFNDFFNLHLIS